MSDAQVPEWLGRLADANKRIAELERIVGKQEEELHQGELRVAELEAKLKWAMGLNACIEHERAEQAEAELAALKGRRCEGCRHWTRHTYDEEGLCTSTITYKPDWAEDDDPPRTVEALALWGSNGEYGFNPPADFACNRWAERGTG